MGVHLLDSVGRHIRVIGRNGDGPGEFRTAPTFGEGRSGTIICYDISAPRQAWMTREGVTVRHVHFNGRTPRSSEQGLANSGPATTIREDGAFIATSIISVTRNSSGPVTDSMKVFLVRDSAERAVWYGNFSQWDNYWEVTNAGAQADANILLQRLFAIGPDPLPLITTRSYRWEVEQYDTAGALIPERLDEHKPRDIDIGIATRKRIEIGR